jgi:hypothetical protein
LALLKTIGGVIFIALGVTIFFFERRKRKEHIEIDEALNRSIKYQGFLLAGALIIIGLALIL